jgi:23S rRNA (cytidine1920-2'-O)/16S rRNA (cytidine1409-2'-O)-methyltransferase
MAATSNGKNKQRLDLLLVERGLAASRTQAQAMIMAGEVSSEGRILDKAGQVVTADLPVELKSRSRYVSRAGEKLASVAEQFDLDFAGKVVLDVGSSTGGFTDFALQHGAARIYAVDVGTGQLDWRLRQDERVVVMEQTDIREAVLPELVDLAVIDVSFISITKILESAAALVKPGAPIVAMMKPQFEAGRTLADKYHGVIDDEAVRQQLIASFRDWLTGRFEIISESDSGLAGTQGNVERFFLLKR